MGERKLKSWLEGFDQYTSNLPSPPLFRKWAAIAAVSGALERKVWIKSNIGVLYPNTYIILVGPAGVGKTVLTDLVRSMWRDLETHFIASSSVTKASLIDDLRDASRRLIKPEHTPSIIEFNSLLIAANELSTLIPGYESDFMSVLTDLWDCKHYSERRRSKDLNFVLNAPQLNLLAATTPSYLNSLMPEGAWEQGFISRTMLVYSGETTRQPIFGDSTANNKLYDDLTHDLKLISELYGKMSFTPEAVESLNEWHMKGGPPAPEHPKLVNYLNRRTTGHILKLCIVASVLDSSDLVITREHFQQALDWMIEYEQYIPDIFKSMASGGDSKAIDELWYFAYTLHVKEGKPIAAHRLINFLRERVPAHSVERILQVMVRAQILKEELEPKLGVCYTPKARKPV